MLAVYRWTAFALLVALGGALLEAKTRKGDKLVKEGEKAEAQRDYDKALSIFEQALATDYSEPDYQLRVRKLRFLASQSHIDIGLKLRKDGKLEEALREFQRAFSIDPASGMAEAEAKRTYEMIRRNQDPATAVKEEDRGLTPAQISRREMEEKMASLRPVPELKPLNPQITNLKMNNQPVRVLFETVGKLAGVNVLFDPDFLSQSQGRNFTLDINNSTIEDALDYVSLLTKAYWKPISANAIFITQDQVTKRRDFEDNVVKVFYLQNVTAPQELNEIAAAVRAVTEIRRLLTYTSQMAIMARGTPDQIALAQKLIYDLDKPKPEVVIDVMVLEANRGRTRDLAATITSGGRGGINLPVTYSPGGTVPDGGDNDSGSSTTPQGFINFNNIKNLTGGDFSVAVPGALVQALLNDRTTRVLQNPQLRTLDSVKATLKIGDRYPYATGSFQPGVGTVGVSPLVSTQFQFAEVGVNVDVTPKIHNNDEVSMHIEIELSNIRDQVDVGGLRQPVIGQRKIFEDIRLKQGEVSLLGGLSSLTNSRSTIGIPGLANTPGLGWLFGTQNSDLNKNELLIVLVPRIVRAPDINEVNMRTISAGNDQVVRLSYEPKREAATNPQTPAPAAPVIPSTPPVPPEPAGEATIRFSPGAAGVAMNSAVMVTVEAANVQDLLSAPFRIRYDPQKLRLVEIARGPLLANDNQPVSFSRDLTSGAVKISRLPGAPGVTGTGVLATLTLQPVAPGETVVTIEDVAATDTQQRLMPIRTQPLTLTIREQ
jgi:general secretion pathway protein D